MIAVKIDNNKVIIGIIIFFGVLLSMYIGASAYFINHFYFKSTLNCIDISGKTVEEANNEILFEKDSYSLLLQERDGAAAEQISGSDIGLKYELGDKVQKLKDNQICIGWISSAFKNHDERVEEVVSYDEDALKKCVDNLECVKNKDACDPQNPKFEYDDESGSYKITEETEGNKINKDVLYDCIVQAINSGEKNLDLDAMDCYEKPKYTSGSQEVIDIKNTLDKYLSSNITYNYSGGSESIDKSMIKDWIDVDNDYNINVSEEKVKKYVNTLSEKYNTVGKTRKFTTTGGSTISVSGGDYGWKIDTKEETNYLISTIKEGKTETREPKYSQTAASHDDNEIGNTYVEISIPQQHLWFYKNGALVTDGSVVTGNISNGRGTPGGVYKIEYKERNATLKGEGYSSPVSFWMPFNGGIGIHDASWRSTFGGNIYATSGSHGCVNAPYSLANTIYNNIDAGTPVVCYN